MFRRFEQVLHTVEAGFARESAGNLREPNPLDQIDDNVSLVHGVPAARLDVWPHPDADAARDPPASNSFAKTFRENHYFRNASTSLANASGWSSMMK